jgi:hypothetical protein
MMTTNRTTLGFRIGLGAIGVAGMLYGLKLLYDKPSNVNNPVGVLKWAIGSDIVIDGLLMPAIAVLGVVLTKLVTPRARRFVQGALIAGAMVTLIAIPLIHRRGLSAPGQSLLLQDYQAHLFLLLGLIAAATVGLYALRVVRDIRQPTSSANVRPPLDQDSSTT